MREGVGKEVLLEIPSPKPPDPHSLMLWSDTLAWDQAPQWQKGKNISQRRGCGDEWEGAGGGWGKLSLPCSSCKHFELSLQLHIVPIAHDLLM